MAAGEANNVRRPPVNLMRTRPRCKPSGNPQKRPVDAWEIKEESRQSSGNDGNSDPTPDRKHLIEKSNASIIARCESNPTIPLTLRQRFETKSYLSTGTIAGVSFRFLGTLGGWGSLGATLPLFVGLSCLAGFCLADSAGVWGDSPSLAFSCFI